MICGRLSSCEIHSDHDLLAVNPCGSDMLDYHVLHLPDSCSTDDVTKLLYKH
jgi:hypothetical protein